MFRPKSTLEQWRIFQAVVEFGGYAQAAEKLNKSQSSLNHAVAKLQLTLGVALLEVRGRKAFLTEEGEVFLRRAKQLTQQMEELELLAFNIHQGWEAEVAIAIELVHPRPLLNRALQHYYPKSRGTQLLLTDTVLTGSQEAIIERQADIVITGIVPKGYLGEPLSEITMLPVCHPLHPLAQIQNELTQSDLSHQLQIVIRDTGKEPQEVSGWLKADQRWTVNNFHEAIGVLLSGLGFAWLPQHLIDPLLQQGRLAQLALTESSARKFFTHLVIPNPEHLGPSARLLVDCIRNSHKSLATTTGSGTGSSVGSTLDPAHVP
ncbi:LysR family transcriptional regulator [Pseudaeromonas sharmana]|uniref:LysR family transcriptional regulator n=1 Tax=Pseudaeromonas sharmana TaxID=328412 RepID=A0ABV8CNK0_9GAMM